MGRLQGGGVTAEVERGKKGDRCYVFLEGWDGSMEWFDVWYGGKFDNRKDNENFIGGSESVRARKRKGR